LKDLDADGRERNMKEKDLEEIGLDIVEWNCYLLKQESAPGSIEPYKAQWLLCVPPDLTFNNSTFCPQSVLMCFVCIRTNGMPLKLTIFYNLVGICLLRGTIRIPN